MNKYIILVFIAFMFVVMVSGCISDGTDGEDGDNGNGIDGNENQVLDEITAGFVDESDEIDIGEML